MTPQPSRETTGRILPLGIETGADGMGDRQPLLFVPVRGPINGLYIGAGSELMPGTFWSGLIDDVRIYDRAVKP
jgi:hypothetical protein